MRRLSALRRNFKPANPRRVEPADALKVAFANTDQNVWRVKRCDGLALAPNEAVNESTVVVDARIGFGRLRYGDGGSCPVSPLRGAGRL